MTTRTANLVEMTAQTADPIEMTTRIASPIEMTTQTANLIEMTSGTLTLTSQTTKSVEMTTLTANLTLEMTTLIANLTRDDHSDSQSHRGDLSDSESYRSRSSLSYNIDNDSTLYQDYYQDDYESDHQEDYDHENDYPSDNQMRDVFDDESDDDDSDVARASDMWQLSVKGPDGSTIFVRIHKDATVDEVISQVSKRKGTPLEHLRVMYTTELLEYGQGKHLSDYHIQDMYTLHYVIDRGGPPSDRQTCSDPQEHQEETTNDPDVDENSNIWQLSAKLNSTSSHCIPIKIHKDAPVDDLIEKISERNKVPIESQSVVFTTKRLEYGQGYHLSDYGIQDKSTLLVVLRLKGLSSNSPTSSTMWQLTVKDQAGLTCHIKICKDTLVDKLIDKVGELYGSRRERLRFLYMGDKPRHLEYGKGKRLSDYGIKDKSTIEVFFRIGGPPSDSHTPQEEQQEDVKVADASDVKKGSNMWQLTVRQLSGHKDDIVIHKDATVDELLGKISERSGVPATQILHVLYKGQKLYQGRHLSDYPLQNNSTLFLALRLGGPQPKPT
ncbi:polyubiquitin-B-like [Branchiostoma floridae]|uniref:Polyubiquitin-B-like n=1 Tax=Branchiostoma floridae TaxID=7739 RepID=A0A9J7N245_BRAFL|nr:polyubiquitin-B-like [Branchiostoma floridae]